MASAAACGVGAGSGDERKVYLAAHGHAARENGAEKIDNNSLFDLASLTKPLATTLLVMVQVSEGRLDLESRIGEFFKNVPPEKEEITISHLLSHSAGFMPHEEFFLRIASADDIFSEILKLPLVYRPGTESVYSDLGFILLGRIVEIAGGKRLAPMVADLYRQAGIKGVVGFLPSLEISGKNICACQMSRWRKRVVRGEVGDDNCYFMGSVAGHAGLFGDITAVTDLCLLLLDLWQGRRESGFLRRDIVKRFFKIQDIPGSTWGLGFDHPDKKESSGGRLISKRSVGHLGYTGTSFWIDPDHDLVVVLLTNRVHPDPENWRIREFRPFFHDRIMEIFFPERA